MIQRLLLLSLAILATTTLSAQDKKIGYGFRAGLSYSKFDGPSEIGDNGENLETFTNDKGFHIGAAFSYKFTDLVGARAELMYTQRGSNINYDGPSYYVLGRNTVSALKLEGMRHQALNVNNTFIDIPIMVYYKLGKFEIFGGLNSGLLIASTGAGNVRISDVTNADLEPDEFILTLDYNYKKDKAGGASVERTPINVSGLNYSEPTTLGAYYEFDKRDKMQYKTLDFGLVGGASFFFNEGLFLSWRYVYGLGDVDRNDYDISLKDLNSNKTHVFRTDNNRSLSMQFSVGFSFGG